MAAVLAGFSQFQPADGRPANDSTEVLVWYSAHAIYFGIRAFEAHGAVHATLADRDKIGQDDYVQILLDTFNDRRRAYAFTVNPFGVQSDGTFSDQNGTDLNPDYQYESKGRVTDFGYEVEVRIPFKSIRFQQTGSQHWGLNVLRGVQHSGHTQTWTPADRGAPSFLSQSGTLRDLPMLIPSTQSGRCAFKFFTTCLAPELLKPRRFTNARSLGRRKMRGLGLPDCASLVTVPTSTKANPSAHKASAASPFLSKPAARPTGFEKASPKRFRFPNGVR